jgi:predicted helicase
MGRQPTGVNSNLPGQPIFVVPQKGEHEAEYKAYWSLADVMPLKNNGVITARDHFVIDFDDSALLGRASIFLDPQRGDEQVMNELGLSENYAWRVSTARKQLRSAGSLEALIQDFLYRPFDKRRILYHPSVVWRTRDSVMRQMIGGRNLGLITTRLTKDRWACVVTNCMIGHKALAAYDINYLFPLHVYDRRNGTDTNLEMFSTGRPNLSPAFSEELAKRLGPLGSEASPELTVAYVYAVFWARSYQDRYSEFLSRDFPRVPLTSDFGLFNALASKGSELVSLHLLESSKISNLITSYPEKGANVVEKVRYTEGDKRVWINKD